MFNFGAYRGFLMLTAFDLCLGACGALLTLAGTAIDFVVDRLTGLVLLQHSWSFLRSEIAAVPIDLFLISGKKFRGHRNIMLVGSCHFYRMNQTTFFIYSDMGFIAKVPSSIKSSPSKTSGLCVVTKTVLSCSKIVLQNNLVVSRASLGCIE